MPSIAQWVRVGGSGLDTRDVTAPDSSMDFSATCDPNTPNGWIITWTAPADDRSLEVSGRATAFDIRRFPSSINRSNWYSAAQLRAPAPGTPGTQHSMSLTVGSDTYVRLRSGDNGGMVSGLSSQPLLFPWTSEGYDCVGGGGMYAGGGPGASFVGENSVLNGASAGSAARDEYRLPVSAPLTGSSLPVRLREVVGRSAALDAARLWVVDHPSGTEIYALGGSMVAGTRQPAERVTSSDGTDLTNVLDGSGIVPLAASDFLSVQLGAGGSAAPIVLGVGGMGALRLEVPDGNSGWRAIGQASPRIEPGEMIFPAPGSDLIRISTRGYANVSFVGRLALSTSPVRVQEATIVSALSTRLGDVRVAVSAPDSTRAVLVGPDSLSLTYAIPAATGGVRDYVLVVDATPPATQAVGPTKLRSAEPALTVRFALEQNRPNPFAGRTTIRFALPAATTVRLEVFDSMGRHVRTLALGPFVAGDHSIEWDHLDASGNLVQPGIYLYRLVAGSFQDQKKMVLLAR